MAQERKETDEKLKAVYRLYQRNVHATDPLVYRITLGARQGAPEEKLLEMAEEALGKIGFGEETV